MKRPRIDWTHVRIARETKRALERFRQERTDMDYPLPASEFPRWDCHTSHDGIIRYLLAQIAEHRRRARDQRQRRGKGKSADRTTLPADAPPASPMLTSETQGGPGQEG